MILVFSVQTSSSTWFTGTEGGIGQSKFKYSLFLYLGSLTPYTSGYIPKFGWCHENVFPLENSLKDLRALEFRFIWALSPNKQIFTCISDP